ncbi:glutathione S-transferase [Thalassospira lucentensis]|uniref:Glutathione S-transferase n=1 Tax=Thalassospira lucentensis TaxID=168935 RepID=A0A358HPL8_9PROT|nr:glutathione S-transferase [Thalassospira lucentensis]HBU97127.1 glutathione S-transferase [Thalassospira lucentensis]HCW65739.1 glutathione S-transferase [Thalassospira lucentensis]
MTEIDQTTPAQSDAKANDEASNEARNAATNPPVLYSFRRCPYAMRARMALLSAGIDVELREVVLRDKPQSMIDASPKATVPVLIQSDGTVIDESLEIMVWALVENDPNDWMTPESGTLDDMLALIAQNDGPFKHHLDRYKYHTRYEHADPAEHRRDAEKILNRLDGRLAVGRYLFGSRPALADFAIAPFVRQFANADRDAFDAMPFVHVQRWLADFLASSFFERAMTKYDQWHEGDAPIVFKAA